MKSASERHRLLDIFSEMGAALRQLALPPALRIRIAPSRADTQGLDAIVAELAQISATVGLLARKPSPARDDGEQDRRHYADLATGWWRIWRKTLRPGSEQPTDEMRRIHNFVEAQRDTLELLGLEIIDHTGKEIPTGLSLEVLGYQVRPGIKRDRVIETVRPTVYHRDVMIQMGRVYAETPPAGDKQP